ncbi:MAG: flagellar filament capping protein FliD [Eubacteriaceae bacterium]
MTSSINFLGSYSGIDQTTIDSLMEAEKLPLIQLSNKKVTLEEKNDAWRDINTRLNSLYEKIEVLQDNDTLQAKTSTSTDSNHVTVTANKNSAVGTYEIYVEQLATSTSVISGEITLADGDNSKALGITGEFTITNDDSTAVIINIEDTDNLKNIVSKINNETDNSGISATIVNSRIILNDENTGERNITLTDDANSTLAKLGLDSSSRTDSNGTNSLFTINGVDVERTTNSVSDVVEYLTINLKSEHSSGDSEIVTVRNDTSKITTAVQDFVDQYNSTMTFIEDKLSTGDPDIDDDAGTLAGDSTLMRLHSSLRSLVTKTIDNENSSIDDISELGVTTIDKYGQLQFDSSKLTEAMQNNSENVINFFSSEDGDGNEIGYVNNINTYIDSFIASDGIIDNKNDSYDKSLADLSDYIDKFNERMERKEEYYIQMFTNLDVALMEAEQQMSWLENQLASMTGTSE